MVTHLLVANSAYPVTVFAQQPQGAVDVPTQFRRQPKWRLGLYRRRLQVETVAPQPRLDALNSLLSDTIGALDAPITQFVDFRRREFWAIQELAQRISLQRTEPGSDRLRTGKCDRLSGGHRRAVGIVSHRAQGGNRGESAAKDSGSNRTARTNNY